MMRANPQICFHTGEFHGQSEWRSVVVEGRYEELPDTPQWRSERDHAWSLLQKHASWWEPGGFKPTESAATYASPHLFFRILIGNMTGRRASA
jgi:nitroimidazol reductase NimA-like FMN-containing flavoprotein (pyridoxamine 5'-phosphate oxidase superfamily)